MNNLGLVHPKLLEHLAALFPATVTIEAATETNTAGVVSLTWAVLAGHDDLVARISPSARGNEFKEPQQIWSRVTHTVTLQGVYASITSKMRVNDGTHLYDILLAETDGQTKVTRLQTEIVT